MVKLKLEKKTETGRVYQLFGCYEITMKSENLFLQNCIFADRTGKRYAQNGRRPANFWGDLCATDFLLVHLEHTSTYAKEQ